MFHNGFMGGMWFSWIFWILIIVFVVYLVVRFTNQKNSNQNIQSKENPIDVIKKRYARGEISKEEFDRIKSDIE